MFNWQKIRNCTVSIHYLLPAELYWRLQHWIALIAIECQMYPLHVVADLTRGFRRVVESMSCRRN